MIATLEGVEGRRARIERRWPRHKWDPSGRSRWAAWETSRYMQGVVLACLLSVLFIEGSRWKKQGGAEPWPIVHYLTDGFVGRSILLLLILAGGWLSDRQLSDQSPEESLVPAWLRHLRRAVLSIPVFGIGAIPLWRRIQRTRPHWAFREVQRPTLTLVSASPLASRRLSRLRERLDSRRRRWAQTLWGELLWLLLSQIAPWLALLTWPLHAGGADATVVNLLAWLSVLIRTSALLLGALYGWLRAKQMRAVTWRVAILVLAPVTFLFQFPVLLVGLMAWMATAADETITLTERIHTLKGRPLFGSASTTEGLAARLLRGILRFGLVDGKGADISAHRLSDGGMSQERRLSFYRLKTLLAFADAAALAWALTKIRGRPPFTFETFTWLRLAPFLVPAALGLLVEVGFLVARGASWLAREKSGYLPYGRSITVQSLTLGSGLLFGSLLATGHVTTAGWLLVDVGLGGVMFLLLTSGPFSSLSRERRGQAYLTLIWMLLFWILSAAGAILSLRATLDPSDVRKFEILFALTPVLSLTLFFALGIWILHPFRLRQIADGSLPPKLRLALAATALTAALPLGAIVVPFWIYLHGRVWPRHESLLWTVRAT